MRWNGDQAPPWCTKGTECDNTPNVQSKVRAAFRKALSWKTTWSTTERCKVQLNYVIRFIKVLDLIQILFQTWKGIMEYVDKNMVQWSTVFNNLIHTPFLTKLSWRRTNWVLGTFEFILQTKHSSFFLTINSSEHLFTGCVHFPNMSCWVIRCFYLLSKTHANQLVLPTAPPPIDTHALTPPPPSDICWWLAGKRYVVFWWSACAPSVFSLACTTVCCLQWQDFFCVQETGS